MVSFGPAFYMHVLIQKQIVHLKKTIKFNMSHYFCIHLKSGQEDLLEVTILSGETRESRAN